LPTILTERVVDEVLIALPMADWPIVETATRAAQEQGKTVRIPLSSGDYAMSHGYVENLSGSPVLTVTSGPTHAAGLALKRTVDIVGSALMLIILSPVFIVVSAAILISDGRPVFFTQQRAGLHGRSFRFVKFRTMVPNAEDLKDGLRSDNERDGPVFKITDDPRITSTGGFLRRSSLDEIPQFWNVLTGDMSLVGPRPPTFDEVPHYDLWQRRRLSLRPGITGIWQVAARGDPSFDRWVALDLEYIDNWSPLLDLRILASTVPAVIRKTGT
jgi:exopolysaccharide biosynthesis polyprenyl glycosylphosphotransferase